MAFDSFVMRKADLNRRMTKLVYNRHNGWQGVIASGKFRVGPIYWDMIHPLGPPFRVPYEDWRDLTTKSALDLKNGICLSRFDEVRADDLVLYYEMPGRPKKEGIDLQFYRLPW